MQRDVRTLPLRLFAVALCVLLPSLALTSCGSTPDSRFYVLTPTEKPASGEPSMRVGLQPVVVLPSVDRPQMLMTVGEHQRQLWEFDRWAGPLPENMTRVLAMNLESHLGLTSVFMLPSRNAPPVDAIVTVEVLQLDTNPNGDCTMVAQFHVADGEGTWITSGQLSIDATDHTDTVTGAAGAAMNISAGLGQLSRIISETLQKKVTVTARTAAGS